MIANPNSRSPGNNQFPCWPVIILVKRKDIYAQVHGLTI